jgi:hypothetical protein
MERGFRRAIVEDISSYRPRLVFVPNIADYAMPAGFDMLRWFLRDPAFAQEWRRYRASGTVGYFEVYEREPASGNEGSTAG